MTVTVIEPYETPLYTDALMNEQPMPAGCSSFSRPPRPAPPRPAPPRPRPAPPRPAPPRPAPPRPRPGPAPPRPGPAPAPPRPAPPRPPPPCPALPCPALPCPAPPRPSDERFRKRKRSKKNGTAPPAKHGEKEEAPYLWRRGPQRLEPGAHRWHRRSRGHLFESVRGRVFPPLPSPGSGYSEVWQLPCYLRGGSCRVNGVAVPFHARPFHLSGDRGPGEPGGGGGGGT